MPGHAPTQTGVTMYPGHPNWKLDPHLFGQPGTEVHQRKGGRNARSKERQCLEALQNARRGEHLDKKCEKLCERFPPGMVYRLRALHDVASDPEHKDFMNAQRMVSSILTHLEDKSGGAESGSGELGVPRIELAHGSVDVPLPGSESPQEPGGTPEGSDDSLVNGNGHHS